MVFCAHVEPSSSDTYFGNGKAISEFKILIKCNNTQTLLFGLLKNSDDSLQFGISAIGTIVTRQNNIFVKSISAKFNNLLTITTKYGQPKIAEIIHKIGITVFALLVVQMDLTFIG